MTHRAPARSGWREGAARLSLPRWRDRRRAARIDRRVQALELQQDLALRLQSVSVALVGATTVADVGEVVVGEAAVALGALVASLHRFDASGDLGLVASTTGGWADPGVVAGLMARAIEREEPIFVERLEAGPRGAASPTFVVAPLECHGELLGMVSFGCGPHRELDARFRHLVRVLVGELASAMERAGLLEREATLRRQIEAEHERLEETLAATDTGWWHWDIGTRTVTWSAGVRGQLGLAPEISLEDLFAVIHPADKRRVASATVEVATAGGELDLEFRALDPRGERYLWTRARQVRDDEGRPIAVDGIIRDVTERRRQDEALRRSERRWRMVLDGLFSFVGLLDRDGMLVEANRAAMQAAEPEATRLLGRPFWDLPVWAEGDGDRLRAAIGRALSGDTERLDVAAVLGGRRLAIDIQMVPLHDDDGAVTGLVLSGLDVTDRAEVEAQRRATVERLALVAAVGEIMDGARSLDARLEAVASVLVPRFGEWGFVDLANEEQEPRNVVVVGPAGSDGLTEQLRHWSLLAGDDELRRRLRRGGLVVVADVDDTLLHTLARDDAHLRVLRRIDPRQLVWVPLFARGRTLGAVALLRTGAPIDAEDVGVLEDLARRVGLAIDNAALYARQERIALELQQSLLPRTLPLIPNVWMAARYRPALSDLAVGGDWYDVIPLPDGATAFVVGDVVGRGLDAASVMGQLRSATRALARQESSPAEVLNRLDDFARSVSGALCTTVAYLRLEADGTRATLALAGHPPPLVVDEAGMVRFVLDGRSPPLGLAGEPRSDAPLPLGPAVQVLLYTDGLVERRGEDLDTGMARLRRWTEALTPARHPLTWIDDLLEGMEAESGSGDDVCVVALQTAPAGAVSLRLELPSRVEALASSRRAVRDWLESAGITGPDAQDVVLAIGEAVSNAMEHAFAGWSGTVRVDGIADASAVEVVVTDAGRWRRPAAPGNRGRGIAIMRGLMDTVDIRSDLAGSVVTMVKVLTPRAEAVLR